MPLQATSGAASYDAFGGGVPVVPQYIEEVFSTYLYTGNDLSTQTITNGIDLSTKGGLVWIKARNTTWGHRLSDTANGVGKFLDSSSTNAVATGSIINAFNTNGFTTGDSTTVNNSAYTYASWTFRKAPKFFDVVTYTGNGQDNRQIAHNLGSAPGCIMVKKTNTTGQWFVYHRGLNNGVNAAQYYLNLETTNAQAQYEVWENTNPTSTVFTIDSFSGVNGSGDTYVAYLFAHDAGGFGLSGTDNVISCGSYTGNGSSAGPTITLGYEPQWILIKRTNAASDWVMLDNMRGVVTNGSDNFLWPNQSWSENGDAGYPFDGVDFNATGFTPKSSASVVNASGSTYIYIAIRRGPMKVPTTGTSVFKPLGISPASTSSGVGFPADMSLAKYAVGSQDWLNSSRLTNKILYTNSTGAEDSIFGPAGPQPFDTQDGFKLTSISTTDYAFWAFKRAPSFFDVVCYTGTGVARTVSHNLAAVPELMIVKCRDSAIDWQVYSSALANTQYLVLNSNAALATGATRWNSTSPTNTIFSVGASGATNGSGSFFVAYLFATCPGVSKVGSYTGNGSGQTIDCGFTSGARFVLLKNTSGTSNWSVYDTARGITTGDDPTLALNSAVAESTSPGVSPASSGFALTNSFNASGATYIFLAIA